MAVISLCSQVTANTGLILCDTGMGTPKRFYIWNGSKVQTSILGDNFQLFMETSSKLSKDDSDKVFPFPKIQNVTDNTEADTTASLNQGLTVRIREGVPSYEYIVPAGSALVAKLRVFNGKTVRILTQDNNLNVWGVGQGANFVGAQAIIYVGSQKFNDGQAVAEGFVKISVAFIDNAELNEGAAFGTIKRDSGIVGLNDVTLKETVAHTSNVYKVTGYISTAQIGAPINVHDYYATELSVTGNWEAFTGANFGTALTITSVANDVTNGGYTVTLDSTAYTALSSGAVIKLKLKAPPVLDAAGVSGIESVPVYLIK